MVDISSKSEQISLIITRLEELIALADSIGEGLIAAHLAHAHASAADRLIST